MQNANAKNYDKVMQTHSTLIMVFSSDDSIQDSNILGISEIK